MATTKYSHAFLVGTFNGVVNPRKLDKKSWIPVSLSHKDYEDRCSEYYKSHIDAMINADGQEERPKFLRKVCHYMHTFGNRDVKKGPLEKGFPVKFNVEKKNKGIVSFNFILCSIHLYFFPLDITIVALEINDTGTDINTLTDSHYSLINWKKKIKSADNAQLKDYLRPLAKLLPNEDLSNMIAEGTKMKIYQIVQTENTEPDDALLYEIASFCPIGVVHGNSSMSPSESYFNEMMQSNSVSAYNNWKALALNDSFTMLSSSQIPQSPHLNIINGNPIPEVKDPSETWAWTWLNLYFPLIYLRCVFEKSFCQSRNNNYREDKARGNLSKEIVNMEKYYFYKNISYNYLPNLLYESMTKGLGIKEEREELSKQIKEKEEKNQNLLLGIVSVFAIFSVAYDFYSLMKAWSLKATFIPSDTDDINLYPILNSISKGGGELPLFALILSILSLIATVSVIWILKSQRRR